MNYTRISLYERLLAVKKKLKIIEKKVEIMEKSIPSKSAKFD